MDITITETITIICTKNEMRDLLDIAESNCSNAVSHVGQANYDEREKEAQQIIEHTFDDLRNKLLKMNSK